ncbi:DegT/DnrJ/EryC1/StrS family aminotransferase [Nocardioides pantholopis]|uniref:DegT/DnrJ/EryC1/StrS family aminotransferase n=1 Tax=Nocardioides pantholopis TaxID=2483798 RepID=UPI000F0953FA|nr:DegT/DnrJ/EryC1/StrS family aminotransferase [Nocardioides pantholopis]
MTTSPRPAPRRLPIPLVDLRPQHDRVAVDVRRAIAAVLDSGAFVLGPAVSRFEEEYAAFCGTAHCVGVGNGTDAIELALRAASVGPGDEVLVPANTFVATAEGVVRAGAELVLVDCDEDLMIDVDAVAARVGPRTRAVVGVDLYGQAAPLERLRAAVGPDVVLLEDAAQSQGATRHGRVAGSLGDIATTSFYPGKNLGAFGDAGAVTTDREDLAHRVRQLRNHGGVERYRHELVGTNSRLDSVQAAVLSTKLAHLKDWNAARATAAARYAELLGGVEEVRLPRVLPGNAHVWHLYVVRVPDRDRVLAELTESGIGAGLHYPTPVHLLPAFASLGLGPGSFLCAERTAGEILSLPMFPGITAGQQRRVAETLASAVSRRPDGART